MANPPFRKRRPIPSSWLLILALGLVFFRINYLPAEQRQLRFSQLKVSTVDNQKYCDLSAVLAWMELDHRGVDTRFECPTCPCYPSPMNYGAGVLWLGRLGLYRITPEGAAWVGPLLIVLFLISLAAILSEATIWQTLYCTFLFFSPPLLLALERGNLDIAIFALLVLAVILESRLGAPWGYAAVVAAGALKYYPFAAGAAFFRNTRHGFAWLAAFCASFGLFVWITRGYIITAQKPDVTRIGWGYSVVFQALPGVLKNHNIVIEPWTDSRMLAAALFCAAVALSAGWIWRRPLRAALGPREPARTLFLSGAILYAALFLLSGNYEYRSVFLLLLLPQLFRMCRENRTLACIGLFLVFLAFTLAWFLKNDWLFLTHQAGYWLLFLFCGTLSFAGGLELLSATPESTPTAEGSLAAAKWAIGLPLALVSLLYWINRPTPHFAPGNLVVNPEFRASAEPWILGTAGSLTCHPAAWSQSAGYPNGGIVLTGCGENTSNPFAAQRITNLTPGASYILTFDWAIYRGHGVVGAGTGKSFGVFIDASGALPSPRNDFASTVPLFVGEHLDSGFETTPPVTFIAAGPSVTLYLEAELDPRTPGGPDRPTDVEYVIDNVDLHLKPPNP